MSKVQVLAGDFGEVRADLMNNGKYKAAPELWLTRGVWKTERIPLKGQIASIESQTEEDVKRLAGTAGWAAFGLAIGGPIFGVLGAVFGGRGKEVCFLAKLHDGRQFLAVADTSIFQAFSGLALEPQSAPISAPSSVPVFQRAVVALVLWLILTVLIGMVSGAIGVVPPIVVTLLAFAAVPVAWIWAGRRGGAEQAV